MSTSIISGNERRSSPHADPALASFRFPSPVSDQSQLNDRSLYDSSPTLSPAPLNISKNKINTQDRWIPRIETSQDRSRGYGFQVGRKSGRQKSIGEALRTIKDRRASVSENVHEIADALKAPLSPKLVLLCGIWFMASIFSNASSKAILTAFRYPVTLTLVQFAFVCSWCVFSSWLAQKYTPLRRLVPVLGYEILRPNRDLIIKTLPMTAFQIGGHILNSDAMSRIPVSLVHTIKGLSPLFTVIAYRVVFRTRVSTATALSLIPLTLGVIMACSANLSGNFLGLLFAFGSTILFVTQNIVSKRLFNEADRAEAEGEHHSKRILKPDKLNLLCYSSGLAFLFTAPLWLWSEGFTILGDFLADGAVELSPRPDALDHGRLAVEFVFNGTFHFGQSLVAFVLLSMVSPVTYSVASLIKRVFVICFSIVWFGNPMTRIQAIGIAMTFVGLYLYDRTNDAAKADRHAKLQAKEKPLLPLIMEDRNSEVFPVFSPSPTDAQAVSGRPRAPTGPPLPTTGNDKKDDGQTQRRPPLGEYRPGTKQEDTWKSQDMNRENGVPLS